VPIDQQKTGRVGIHSARYGVLEGAVRGEVWVLANSIPYTLLLFRRSVQFCTLASAMRPVGLHVLFADA
jgi:hypothetical protein